MEEELTPGSARWRFAAHLGISDRDKPLLGAMAGSLDPVEQIACAADLGFAGICDNGLMARDAATQRRMGRALRQHGLAMGSFTFEGIGKAPFYWGMPVADMARTMAGALAVADRIGGGCIVTLLRDDGSDPICQRERAAENLALAAEIGLAAGIGVAIEAVSRERVADSLIERGAEAAALIGSGRLRLAIDSCHCHLAGEDMAALILAQAERLAVVQIADMPGRVEPGAGDIDFAPVMAALAEIGWDGLVEAEFDPAGRGGAGLRRALAGLRSL